MAGNTDPNLLDATANPVANQPAYQSGQDSFASLDPSFSPGANMLGSAIFFPTGVGGSATVIPLTFSPAQELAIISAVNGGGGPLRLLVASGTAGVALTGGGLTNNNGAPLLTITYNAVPEPSTAVLLSLGAVAGLLVIRRRRGK